MTTEITTTPIGNLDLGDYLLTYGEDGDGEAGTYDEREYDDLERCALDSLQNRLPSGWTAGTETDSDGCYLVARAENGETCSSWVDIS